MAAVLGVHPLAVAWAAVPRRALELSRRVERERGEGGMGEGDEANMRSAIIVHSAHHFYNIFSQGGRAGSASSGSGLRISPGKGA